MTHARRSVALCALCALVTLAPSRAKAETFLSVELEPLQFINSGWSVVAHYTWSERVQIGANAFASQLSPGFTALAFATGEGLELSADQDLGVNVSARYFLTKHEIPRGVVVSVPIGWETWTLRDASSGQESTYRFWYASPRVGYLWHPFIKREAYALSRLYLLVEAVAIIPFVRSDDAMFQDATARIRSIIPLPSVGLGFAF